MPDLINDQEELLIQYEAIVSQFKTQFLQERNDFDRFWYEGIRFNYQPFVEFVNAPFASETLNINNLGFRGRQYHPKKVSPIPRIGFFGSSAMVGIPNLNDSQTIPERVNYLLKEEGIVADVMNFGVMCSTIKHDLNHILRITAEYDLDAIVLYSGYNDMYLASLGELWVGYQEVNDVLSKAFDDHYRRNSLRIQAKRLLEAFKQHISVKNNLPGKMNRKQKLRLDRAQTLDFGAILPVYEKGREIYLQYLKQVIEAAKYRDIPLIYAHQVSHYATKKKLSDYENAIKYVGLDFGFPSELRKFIEGEFSRNFNIQYNDSLQYAGEHGAVAVDLELQVQQASSDENLFYDYCHLLTGGVDIIARKLSMEIATILPKNSNNRVWHS